MMNEHIDCIDAVEWCALHVKWLPGRVNPNIRAARWAHQHGKTLIACSDAHSLEHIGRNASTVEAAERTPGRFSRGIRAGRVTFHRGSLELGPFFFHAGRALAAQRRHVGRWLSGKLSSNRG